ncbi:MAG: phosphatase PAP2 family protein [Actinomycetota bacterium]
MNKPDFSELLQGFEDFDTRVDESLEVLRDSPIAARVFTSASHLGDFSLIWHIVAAARGVTSDRRADQALALSALLGAESLIVNQGIKKLFRRQRPTESGDERFDVRTPSTSSFPSGHASSAFFAATLLTYLDGRRSAPMWFGLAGVVATSRAFVRIHHASDVIGGAAVGLGLGMLARPLVKRLK